MIDKAIGGYFELELPKPSKTVYPDAYRFQSARSAFYTLLLAGNPKKVWMPFYLCDSMFAPLRAANIEYECYSINDAFEIQNDLVLNENEWLLYVNYFGVCTYQQHAILKRFNPSQIVFDHSQAFYAPPLNCLATIYSPRKFFGVPDGGLLLTDLQIDQETSLDTDSINRTTHLLKRLSGTAESGYADFQVAEKTLENISLKEMSGLTSKILNSINTEDAKLSRNKNFEYLHAHLGTKNHLTINMESVDGPLCYPFLCHSQSLRSHFLQKRIFISTYWPDVRTTARGFESELMSKLLPLPCDQRYQLEDMMRIIDVVGEFHEH